MFLLYNLLLTLLSPFWVPWMIFRASKRKEKPDWKERQGDFSIEPPKKGERRIWIHAVSVGEVVAVLPILKRLKEKLPDHQLVLSVTTSSGHQTALDKAAGLYHHLVYFPIDVPRFQLAGMSRVRPVVVAVMETELWFNYLWAAKSFRAKTMLINGRISDRSFPRARLFRFFFKAMLRNIDRCLMQSSGDKERIEVLGAISAEVFGNCKFDEAVEGLDADPKIWRSELDLRTGTPVIVVGSTRSESEESLILDSIQRIGLDDVQVIHAPRHLERAGPLAAEVERRFGRAARRSKKETGPYLVLDTYGELNQVYSVADLVVIGGGFDDLGGQNLIQPLAHGKPVLHGPHMQNFREAASIAGKSGATRVCSTVEELTVAIQELLNSPELRETMGRAARELVRANLGASERYVEAIAEAATPS